MPMGDIRRKAVVIEDDDDVRSLLKSVLTQGGFEAILTSNGEDGVAAVRRHNPDVTTLDVSMPGMDGFATAKRIREFSSTSIIMLTALGDEIDVVQGLDSGADDYVVKPFRPRELRARIESVLRRKAGFVDSTREPVAVGTTVVKAAVADSALLEKSAESVVVATTELLPQTMTQPATTAVSTVPEGEGWMRFKGIALNSHTRIVLVDERNVALTRSEFDLIESMLSSGRRVRSKADLVLMLRGESYVTAYFVNDADKKAVEVHMANLRRKLGDNTANPRWIETVRGVGYRIAADN